MRRLTLLALVATLLSRAAPAGAQDTPAPVSPETTERARTLFQEGLRLADEGDWERAVHRFRRALELRESAPVRYNLATSLAHMGRRVEAIEELDRVLAHEDADQEIRASAIQLRRELSSRLGRLRVDVRGDAHGTLVTVDGRPWSAVGAVGLADPGVRVVRLLRDLTELDVEEADLAEGGDARVVLEVPGTAPASDDAWIWGIVIGVALVAIGAGIVTGVVLADMAPQPSPGDFGPPFLEVD